MIPLSWDTMMIIDVADVKALVTGVEIKSTMKPKRE